MRRTLAPERRTPCSRSSCRLMRRLRDAPSSRELRSASERGLVSALTATYCGTQCTISSRRQRSRAARRAEAQNQRAPGVARGSSRQLDRSRSRSFEPSVADRTEAIVDAHHEAVDVLLDIDGERRPADDRCEGYAGRAEIEIVVLGECRPIAGERPLDAAANGPSRCRRIRVCERGAPGGDLLSV